MTDDWKELEERTEGRVITKADIHPCFVALTFDDGSTLEIEGDDGVMMFAMKEALGTPEEER